MPLSDFSSDVVPRTPGSRLRIASFNVENLFTRPIAMNYVDNNTGQPFLDAYHQLNSLFAKPVYSEEDASAIVGLMTEHGLVGSRPQNKHLEFRKIRGTLLRKSGDTYTVAAAGRADWVGWIELKEKEIDDQAILNTARVLAAVDADIVALVEVEDRPGLLKFNTNVLGSIFEATGRKAYPFALVVDGNDQRGIDVGILSRFPITDITTHVFDLPEAPPIFSRDCAEYFLEVPGIDARLLVMVNHFASKGSDASGMQRRIHQARRVRDIVTGRLSQGFGHVIVAGDLNDTPLSNSLAPLLTMPELKDAISMFAQTIDPTGRRLGTYTTGREQIDYLLLSDKLAAAANGAGIERRGHYAPRTFKSFDTVTSARYQASDHHCIWVDLAIG
jgi:endonuclease/exonuclease/phosphatase family metal-dependent hydrolase